MWELFAQMLPAWEREEGEIKEAERRVVDEVRHAEVELARMKSEGREGLQG